MRKFVLPLSMVLTMSASAGAQVSTSTIDVPNCHAVTSMFAAPYVLSVLVADSGEVKRLEATLRSLRTAEVVEFTSGPYTDDRTLITVSIALKKGASNTKSQHDLLRGEVQSVIAKLGLNSSNAIASCMGQEPHPRAGGVN